MVRQFSILPERSEVSRKHCDEVLQRGNKLPKGFLISIGCVAVIGE